MKNLADLGIFHKSGVFFHSETIVYSPVRLVSCERRNVVKNISSKQPTYVYVIAWIKERRRSEFIIRKNLFIISKMLKVKLHSIFFQLCLSVCLSACLSVCLSYFLPSSVSSTMVRPFF